MQNCSFNGNTAFQGGGIYFRDAGTVYSSSFTTNTASNSGGGVCCYQGGTVKSSTFEANYAPLGGGAYCRLGGAIYHSVFDRNLTDQYGGGVFCSIGGKISFCSIMHQGPTTNTVYSNGANVRWMSVWTNDVNNHCYVIYSTSLNN
jgi:predicted outer membrane repeat protein